MSLVQPFLTRRRMLCSMAALAAAGNAASQEAWPSKPIRLMVIAAPGGLPDVTARLLAQQLEKALGQPVVVENRAGGGGNIAASVVAKAPADGYTLLVTGVNHAVNPVLLPNPGFDYVKDFAPVSLLAEASMVLVASPLFPAKTLQEAIAIAKREPRSVSIAISPIGTPNHLGAELLIKLAGIDLNIVPYKGIAPSIPDLVSGRLQLAVGALPSVLPLIQAGKLRALAVSRTQRSSLAPEIPTAVESGLKDFELNAWVCVMATGGTPQPIVQRLSSEIRKAMELPAVRESMAKQGIEPLVSSPEELGAFLNREAQLWSSVLKTAKVRE